jgi:hypothetical protein
MFLIGSNKNQVLFIRQKLILHKQKNFESIQMTANLSSKKEA